MVPDIQQIDIEAVVSILQSGMLIQGTKVEQFENNIAEYLKVKHAIAVSNGTASLHLALVALGIGIGDEVIIPAFSYIATANVVEIVGATPIFVDIEIESFNINVDLIEKAITSKTKAIIPVHEFGMACDISKICVLAKKYDIMVIEDAACALGATENGKYAGTFGDIGSFSFHPRKAITSGEGGLLVTNDDKLARKFRILRNHGIEFQNGKMEFVDAGFNYRMTDFQAALVNSQFRQLKSKQAYKNKLASWYQQLLGNTDGIILPIVPFNKNHTWQSFHIILKDDVNRDKMIENLKNNQIGVNLGAQCIPSQKYYKRKYNLNCDKLYPKAIKAYKQGLVLPLYGSLKFKQVMYITNVLKNNISQKLNKLE